MPKQNALAEWNRIPSRIQAAIRGLDAKGLDRAGGDERWSIRETVHHLVEANLIASNMIIAALGVDGYEFDWTWVNPDKAWMRRLGYTTSDVKPALAVLRSLCAHLSALLESRPNALSRTVSLNDSPGAPRYTKSVAEILEEQIEHAADHLQQIRDTRRRHCL